MRHIYSKEIKNFHLHCQKLMTILGLVTDRHTNSDQKSLRLLH